MSNLTPIRVIGDLSPSGTQNVNVVSSITIPITASSLPLPIGAATETTLSGIKTDLDKFTFTGGALNVAGSFSLTLDHSTSNILVYGNDGTTDRKLLTNASGNLQVGVTNASFPVTQSGAWNITNISGTISLPTGAATETTLLAIKTDADKFTFASTKLLVDGSGVTQPVSGSVSISNFPATQAVTQSTSPWVISAASLPLPTGAATETTLLGIKTDTDKLTFASTRLLVDGSGVTQPISGTITANQGTSPWVVSGTITTSPNVNVHDGAGVSIGSTGSSLNVSVTNTVPVTGTFFQSTQPVSSVGNFTVVQSTGTNLHTVLDSGTLTGALPAGSNVIGHVIADSGSTTVITGNVTVVQPTGTNLHAVIDSGTVTTNAPVSLISTTLNPAWSIGTIGYYQTGVYGTALGLLLALTVTPQYIKMIMTDHGLRKVA